MRHEWDEVRRLYRNGASKTEIARRLGMSRNTVARLLTLDKAPRYIRKPMTSKLDPFKSAVLEMLAEDADIPATVIRTRLRQQGYGGGITILRDYVARVRPRFKATDVCMREIDAVSEGPKASDYDANAENSLDEGARRCAWNLPTREERRDHSRLYDEKHPTARRIVNAGIRILVERGYNSLTLEAVAAEACANKAGVWYHFGGKQGLLLAIAEGIIMRESGVYGRFPDEEATLSERIDLIIGSVGDADARVRRFRAFYELLTNASRNEALQQYIRASYQSWYDWATSVISPSMPADSGGKQQAAAIARFASLLLDGIFVEMIIAAPGFDSDIAWSQMRVVLKYLASVSTAY